MFHLEFLLHVRVQGVKWLFVSDLDRVCLSEYMYFQIAKFLFFFFAKLVLELPVLGWLTIDMPTNHTKNGLSMLYCSWWYLMLMCTSDADAAQTTSTTACWATMPRKTSCSILIKLLHFSSLWRRMKWAFVCWYPIFWQLLLGFA